MILYVQCNALTGMRYSPNQDAGSTHAAEFLDSAVRRAELHSNHSSHGDATGCELLNTSVEKSATVLQYGRAEVLAMTVLLVLVFFAALITMDYMVTRHRLAREAKALASAALPAVDPAWVAGYQM